MGYGYAYDQRNQLTRADWVVVSAQVAVPDPLQAYRESIGAYDLNGNISSLQRHGDLRKPADRFRHNLTYHYKPFSNLLDHIEDQDKNETFRSYAYNDLGQLTQETEGDREKFIDYDPSGKVTAVYADEARTQPVVRFTYDDRGFRLSKTSYDEESNIRLETWYVRDASGMIVSVYENDVQITGTLRQTEIPVYGIGRLGVYKPEYGIAFYEMTDHLGNVRAVIGEEIEAEYMATMETERYAKEVHDGFQNMNPVAVGGNINHTPAEVVVDGEPPYLIANSNEVDRLNNRPNGIAQPDPIGTGIMLWVHPGDVIEAEVFAKYINFDANNVNIVSGLVGFLSSAFTTAPVVDGASLFSSVGTPEFSALPVWSKLNSYEPQAFLSYLLFDNDFKLQEDGFDFAQVSEAAEIPMSDPQNHEHERLSLQVTVRKEGFIYIYVSNLSDQNMDVYFDDLRIKHKYSSIVAGGDYYPFGLSIKDRTIHRDPYRFGYQGQFAEKDEETGWNHFELREYDAIIGRWTAVDPKRIGFSPYIGMYNNPVSGTDPDGGGPDDWFKDQNGNVQWFASSAEGFSDADGNSWSNIGTELLDFDGQFLTHLWQTGNELDGFLIFSRSYRAVSGSPIDENGWATFDYSVARQQMKNIGPIPEGLYSITKSGMQSLGDMSSFKQALAPFGYTAWPGGSSSWGNYRWWPSPDGTTNTFGRSGFSIHGGVAWGSRGCIDLGMGMNEFVNDFKVNALSEKIYLNVKYTTPSITIIPYGNIWRER